MGRPLPCTLRLSWVSNHGEIDMQAQPLPSSRTETACDAAKPAILLVDDEPTTRMMTARKLRRAGYEVDVAENGKEALDRLRQRLFPILLTDWEMPAMDGLELCRAVRAARFDSYVYIILLTARNSKANVIEGLEAGADEYISKPVNDHELAARLQTAQRILRLEQSLRAANQRNLLLSITDALTGAHNRHYLMSQLPKELGRTHRYARPLSAVLCDIDRFKTINDRYGHQVGDDALVQFAALLQRSIRSEVDWVVRYGGEEFLVVLPETDFGAALAFAERVRNALEAQGVETTGGSVSMTASFGVTSYSGASDQAKLSVDTLIAAADACLYRAKRAGRNRIIGKSFDEGASTVILERPADRHFGDALHDETAAAKVESIPAPVTGNETEPVDWPGLLESLDGDEGFARELAQTYIDSVDSLLADLAAAVDRGDYDTVRSKAHALKGASAEIGACRAADAAAKLETAALAGEPDGLGTLAAKLTRDVGAAADYLRSKTSSEL